MTVTVDESFLAEVAQSAFGWPESLRFTYGTVAQLIADGVDGDLVECGVAAGVHPAMMSRACQDVGAKRNIRLFDSFEGVPHGGPHDVEWNAAWGDGSGRLEPTGVAMATLQDVRANLERWGCDGSMFSFYVGWFQKTLPPIAETWRAAVANSTADGIAFLRLDGDLYESTIVCLRELYPLVVSGGVVVVDDWNLDGCRQALCEYLIETEQLPHRMHDGSPDGIEGFHPDVITESGDVWWRKP